MTEEQRGEQGGQEGAGAASVGQNNQQPLGGSEALRLGVAGYTSRLSGPAGLGWAEQQVADRAEP